LLALKVYALFLKNEKGKGFVNAKPSNSFKSCNISLSKLMEGRIPSPLSAELGLWGVLIVCFSKEVRVA
jgi:hypothetical protein